MPADGSLRGYAMTAREENRKARLDKESRTKIALTATAGAVNLALGVVKLYAGVFTNSISIIGDGINNFGDVFANAGATAGFAVENRKPSAKFPFGYGRVEYVVAFLMSIVVVVVGCVFAYSALDRFFYRQIVTFAWTQFWIVFATVFVKAALAVVFGLVYKKIPSEVLKAQQIDSILDSLVTVFALLGLFLYRYISFPVDAVIALVISVMLIAAGVKLLASSFARLMNARDDLRTDGLVRLAKAQEGVLDATARVYDFGRNCAEANVGLSFSDAVAEEDRKRIEAKIAAVAANKGIKVTFVGYEAPDAADGGEGEDGREREARDDAVASPPDGKEEK